VNDCLWCILGNFPIRLAVEIVSGVIQSIYLLNLFISEHIYIILAVITRPPDGVLLVPSALAALRLRRLASLLKL